MAIVVVGTLVGVKEEHYESSRGPQTELKATVQQAGQDEKYPLRLVVSYKVWDKFKAFKPGTLLQIPLFTEIKPKGKNGPWAQYIALDATEVRPA